MTLYHQLSQFVRNLMFSGHVQFKAVFLILYVGLVWFSLAPYGFTFLEMFTEEQEAHLRRFVPVFYLMCFANLVAWLDTGLNGETSSDLPLATSYGLFFYNLGDFFLMEHNFFPAIFSFGMAHLFLIVGLCSRLKRHFNFENTLPFITFLFTSRMVVIDNQIVSYFSNTRSNTRVLGFALFLTFVLPFVLQVNPYFHLILYLSILFFMLSLHSLWLSLEDGEGARYAALAGFLCAMFNVHLIVYNITPCGFNHSQITFRLVYYFMLSTMTLSAIY